MVFDNIIYKLAKIFCEIGYKEEISSETSLEDIINNSEDVLSLSLMIDANFDIECDYNVIEDAEIVMDIIEHISELTE